MTNQESDGMFENDWDDRSELSWREADWERYLADQEKLVRDYGKIYDRLPVSPDRIDQVARRLGWEPAENPEGDNSQAGEATEDSEEPWEPYTMHRNPVYVATKAIYRGLIEQWERLVQRANLPGPLSVTLRGLLHRGEEAALNGVQALDIGDYTLALCFFKRALQELNRTMSCVHRAASHDATPLAVYRDEALPRLFDLREIWLRVMYECRAEADEDQSGA